MNTHTHRHFFSASENVFLAAAMRERYTVAGSWPEDAVAVTDEVYTVFGGQPPAGQIRGIAADGSPCWVNAPVAQLSLVDQARSALARAQQTVWAEFGALGDAVPAVWIAYQRALRAIVDGTDTASTDLPTAPGTEGAR